MFVSALCLYIALMVAQTNILSTFVSAKLSIIQKMSWGDREGGGGGEGWLLQSSLQSSRPLRASSDS